MRAVRSDAVGYGRNADILLDNYVKCARCGFTCNLDRDVRAPYGSRAGWGLRYERIYVDTFIASADVSDSTVTIGSGSAITTETGISFVTEDGQVLGQEE